METAEKKIESAEVETQAVADDNGPLFVLLETEKVKLIRSTLGERTYFESDENESAFEKANKHVTAAAEKTEMFFGLKIAMADGIETASRIVVATVGVRDKGDPTAKPPIPARNGMKAIVLFKQPSFKEFLADESEAAQNFVQKLIEREATDVAFSGIRNAETGADLQTVMAGLPDTVGGIVENARVGSGAGATSFDIMWADFRRGFLKVKYPQLDAVLPQKPEIIRAIKSKSYALANPATKPIEENGYFVKIALVMRKAAESWKNEEGEPDPLNTDDMQAWLDNRDSNVIDFKVQEVTAASIAGLDF